MARLCGIGAKGYNSLHPTPAPAGLVRFLPEPTMDLDPKTLDALQATLQTAGPDAAIDRLCDELKVRAAFQGLFYAILTKKRLALGLSPRPTGHNRRIRNPPPAGQGA